MRYPNASKGLRTIVMAEIVAAAASVIAVIVSVLAMLIVESPETESYEFGAVSIIMLVIIAMYIAAFITEIFGIVTASKDEPAFKVSLYAIIASIILTVLAGFFYENETVFIMISIAGDVAQFFLVHYIIHGIMHLSEHLGRPEVSKNGKRIFKVIYLGIIFEVIVRIIEIIYGHNRGEELAMPFDVIANILKAVEYIMFLIYILKGSKMLKESTTDNHISTSGSGSFTNHPEN